MKILKSKLVISILGLSFLFSSKYSIFAKPNYLFKTGIQEDNKSDDAIVRRGANYSFDFISSNSDKVFADKYRKNPMLYRMTVLYFLNNIAPNISDRTKYNVITEIFPSYLDSLDLNKLHIPKSDFNEISKAISYENFKKQLAKDVDDFDTLKEQTFKFLNKKLKYLNNKLNYVSTTLKEKGKDNNFYIEFAKNKILQDRKSDFRVNYLKKYKFEDDSILLKKGKKYIEKEILKLKYFIRKYSKFVEMVKEIKKSDIEKLIHFYKDIFEQDYKEYDKSKYRKELDENLKSYNFLFEVISLAGLKNELVLKINFSFDCDSQIKDLYFICFVDCLIDAMKKDKKNTKAQKFIKKLKELKKSKRKFFWHACGKENFLDLFSEKNINKIFKNLKYFMEFEDISHCTSKNYIKIKFVYKEKEVIDFLYKYINKIFNDEKFKSALRAKFVYFKSKLNELVKSQIDTITTQNEEYEKQNTVENLKKNIETQIKDLQEKLKDNKISETQKKLKEIEIKGLEKRLKDEDGLKEEVKQSKKNSKSSISNQIKNLNYESRIFFEFKVEDFDKLLKDFSSEYKIKLSK